MLNQKALLKGSKWDKNSGSDEMFSQWLLRFSGETVGKLWKGK